MFMKRGVVVGALAGLMLFWGACSTPQFQTLKIFDSPNRVVALRAIPDAYGGKGYDHPVSLTTEEMSRLLKGVRVERGLLSSTQHAALSETEIRLFAPHFVKALQQATREEMVTFFETADLGDDHQLTTSGGLFVAGGNLHVIMSNFSVKTRIWQDNERYEASFRDRPLDQMEPQPGRLVYEPREFMVDSPDGEIGSRFKGKPWQVAIRYQALLGK
ncbi:MAG: hypothetical protein OEY91_02405 [Nitrospirota bacterium]|nr:hypothetical protein [Nitrospirota bacterium]